MKVKEYISHGIPVTQVHVQTEQDAKALARLCGQYITLDTGPLDQLVSHQNVCACLADQLRCLLKPFFGKTLCVCGIGNRDMPSDSLGPETARRFRPQMYEASSLSSNFEKIAVICPDTGAQTNLSTEAIIAGVTSQIGAACVLTVDACTCKEAKRLCSAIDVTDTGMQTYSKTSELRQSTLGIPVISIEVPTAIRAADLSVKADTGPDCFLTPINISAVIDAASFIIACAISQMVYPELDYKNCKQYIEFSLHGVV